MVIFHSYVIFSLAEDTLVGPLPVISKLQAHLWNDNLIKISICDCIYSSHFFLKDGWIYACDFSGVPEDSCCDELFVVIAISLPRRTSLPSGDIRRTFIEYIPYFPPMFIPVFPVCFISYISIFISTCVQNNVPKIFVIECFSSYKMLQDVTRCYKMLQDVTRCYNYISIDIMSIYFPMFHPVLPSMFPINDSLGKPGRMAPGGGITAQKLQSPAAKLASW